MKGIENRVEFRASPRIVYRAIANPQNIPLYVPGVLKASVVNLTPNGVGTRIDLETRHRHTLPAVITEEADRHFLSIQDDHGTVNEWELRKTPTGTLGINRIIGDFDAERAADLEREAREKLYAFRDIVEANGS